MLAYLTPSLILLVQLSFKQVDSRPANSQQSEALAVRSLQDRTAIYWYTEVTIGTQAFNLTVDTGSSDLWVYGPTPTYTGTDAATVASHTPYTCNPATSANQCKHEGNFSIGYGGDTYAFGASGYFVADRVTVADKTVPTMSVEVATDVGWPAQWSQDGFLGLSWNIHNEDSPQQATFSQCILVDPALPSPIFTVDFPSTGNTGGKVEIAFGSIDKTKAAAGLVEADVEPTNPTWSTNDVSFIVGDGTTSNVFTNDKATTVLTQNLNFDTGAGPDMTVDPRLTRAYYASVPNAHAVTTDSAGNGISYRFPCTAHLPDLSLLFTSGGIRISGTQLSYNVPDSNNMCAGPLDSTNTPEGGQGGVGTLFFEAHYVVFDMTPGKPKLQIAPWNGTAGGTGSSISFYG